MKNDMSSDFITFDDCQKRGPIPSSAYLHAFKASEVLSDNGVVLHSSRPIRANGLKGFYSLNNQDLKIRATAPKDLVIKVGGEYLCAFVPSQREDMSITILSANEIGKSVSEKPVMQMMFSWRLKFLGRSLLNTLYKRYGEDSFNMILHAPETIRELLGLDNRRLQILTGEVSVFHENWHMLNFFLTKKFNMQEAEMFVDILKSKIKNEKTDPFSILVARTMNKDLQHRFFAAMGIYDLVKTDTESVLSDLLDAYMKRSGETALLYSDAINLSSDALKIDKRKVERTLQKMLKAGRASYRKLNGEDTISLGKMKALDTGTAENFALRVDEAKQIEDFVEVFDVCKTIDGRAFELTNEQKIAIQTSVSTHTSVITGGPGTGKTTCIKALIHEVRKVNQNGRIFLAAPTGKAAKRMAEVTGHPCTTLHRMMGMTPDSSPILSSFGDGDTLILDECSLMDIYLFSAAIKHTGNRGRVVMLGDIDQLESIELGSALNDIIQCRQIAVAVLSEVQRQAAKSNIVMGSYCIRDGKLPNFDSPDSDLHFIEANSPTEVKETIGKLVRSIQIEHGADPAGIQILSAMRKGIAGVNNLNEVLKPIFNEDSVNHDVVSRALGNQIYHVGDRVMQLQNRYDLDIQNGEVGTIVNFDEKKRKVILQLDDRTVALPYDNYQFMTHAWAFTFHKSQGSEYPFVIISLPDDHLFMLNRKSIFTAITRGKEHVYIVGSKRTLELAISNDPSSRANRKRLSHLAFELSERIAERSHSKALRLLAEKSRKLKAPSTIHETRADEIVVPF